jgi:iron(III) transport system substrate-binding protein
MSDTRPCWPFVLLAALAAALLVGCPAPREQQPIRVVVSDDSDNRSSRPSATSVLELARREGELWWYTSLPDKPAQEFIGLFTRKHPFLTVRLVRESTFDIIQRLQTEVDNGRVQADVLHVLDVAPFVKLKKQGQILRYESPEERFIPAQYKDPGVWSALRCVALCIAYNTDKVKIDPPRTWPDLLQSRFVGRIALKDAQTAGSAYAHYFFLREEYGVSYWKRMSSEKPQMFKTAEESMNALKAGSVDIVSGAMDYTVDDAQRSGSPIRAIWPTDGVPVMLGPVAILRGAPHPNAARLFMDFALSAEGQKSLRDLLGGYSVRADVPAPEGLPPLANLHTMTPAGGWEAYTASQDILKSEYTRLFHPGSE